MKNKYKFDSDEYLYKNIRKILNEFSKKNYWANFTSADIFYFMIKDKERILKASSLISGYCLTANSLKT